MRCLCAVVVFLIVPGVFFSCRQTPALHPDTTYFEIYHIRAFPQNALSHALEAPLPQTGVFLYYFYAVKEMPALLFLNAQDQIEYVLLSDSLNVNIGDYVRLSGNVIPSSYNLGDRNQTIQMLKASTVELLSPSNLILQNAKNEYLQRRLPLQETTRVANSKLELPEQPEWLMVVDETRSNVIVYFTAADLMYAAEINFVYDRKRGNLTDIYGKQWFKGE